MTLYNLPYNEETFDDLNSRYAVLSVFVEENLDKYEKMLWYQRSPGPDIIHEVFKDTPEDIIQGALKAQKEVEKEYPEMVLAYETKPDWQHGWVSGMVAMLRLVNGVLTAQEYEVEDDDESYTVPREVAVMEQLEFFPDLDS